MGSPDGQQTANNSEAQPTVSRLSWRALTVLGFVQFMLVVDDTVVNVALPSIRSDLGFGISGLAWVVNGYVLTFGGLILLGGRAGDLIGHRRLFLVGLTVFALASLSCGLAQEPWQLIASRFAQGAGAAMASPAALALVTLLFAEGPARTRALGIWGGIAAFGVIVGYVLSGVLTDFLSWRWVFFINLPVAVAGLALVPRLVARDDPRRGGRIDLPGAALGTGALVALVYGLLSVPQRGWGSGTVMISLGLAVVLAIAFLTTELRTRNPLVPLSFFADRTRAVGNGIMMLLATGLVGMFFLMTLHVQEILGWSPLQAGLGFVPMAVALLAVISAAPQVMKRLGQRGVLIIGPLIVAAGLLLLIRVSPDDSYLTDLLPAIVLIGVGAGVAFPAVAGAAMSGTTPHDAGLGSGMLNAVQQVGGAVGLAILVSVASTHTRTLASEGHEAAEATTAGFALSFGVAAGLLGLAALLAAVALGRIRPPGSGGQPDGVVAEQRQVEPG